MELAWLEDFLALSSTLNFSRAAEMRNVTQPTFSRRIQNLELWVGAPLVDRSTFPAALTEQGKSFRKAAEEVVQTLYRERDQCKGIARPRRTFLSFAMLQTVAISFYPEWLRGLEAQIGSLRTRVSCANLHDCVQTLVTGSCDIMICYAWPSSPLLLDGGQYPSLCLADEYLLPVSAPQRNGQPLHDLDRGDGRPVSYLAYAGYASLATMVDSIVSSQPDAPTLDLCYESALAAALKSMAMAGHGVAWLPYHVVKAELEGGLLVPAGAGRWIRKIDIRAYRASDSDSREIERVWDFLAEAGPMPSDFTGYAESAAAAREVTTRAVRPIKPHRAAGHGRRARGGDTGTNGASGTRHS
ncbi:LysR family transcriptional regulator [Burkholderia sp. WAC0059]|uniref:LysR family transcriptional regulator n=1 Tax=Burkholderia sp. WAC0059 TaxID=2066022 RepID=UPI000C7EEA00|nr:LysR family transcriptional regulator [Burkholderia sp. WAC0059]PLZ01518.1 LysR family transcriptional regulator [Burkholderia sp. WAC0059]